MKPQPRSAPIVEVCVQETIARSLLARPLLGLCAAIVAGSTTGASLPGCLELLRAAVVGAVIAWGALLALRRDERMVRAGLLLVCASIAALRASSERELEIAAAAEEVQRGTYCESAGVDGALARLEGSPRTWSLPVGLVAVGERVVVDPIHEPAEWARGEDLGPRRAHATRPTVELSPGEIARVAIVAPSVSGVVAGATATLRARLAARTSSIADPTTRALVTALLFGDTSKLAPELPDLFVRTGTFHVLAVSGMQVVLVLLFLVLPTSAILAAVIALLTRGKWRPASRWIALPALILFVPIAGGGAPIVRSSLGAAFGLIAPHFSAERAAEVVSGGRSVRVRLARRADGLSCWALALILECALHPLATTSLSVQLSYAATFGLMAGTGPCLALVRDLIGLGAHARGSILAPVSRLGRPRSPWLLVGAERAAHASCCAVAASCAAVLATLPFVWERLAEWSPWGVFATPALGPPAAVLFVGGWLDVAFPSLMPDALLDASARAVVGSMRVFDLLPGTPTPLPPRPQWLIILACVSTLCALRRSRPEVVARCAAILWAVVLVPWSPTSARFEIRALDVGAGTAVVCEGPGLGTWVFDAGSRDRPDVAREALAPLLRRLDPGPIGIVLSHADRDHDGALPWLVERHPPRVFAGALPARLAERLPHACTRVELDSGSARIVSLEQATLEIQRGLCGAISDNEASYTLVFEAGGARAVFFGDAEARGLDAWIARLAPGTPSRLVLWPHHGSDCDRLDALLRAVRPEEVWISASGRPPALAELERRALVTKCTAREGPLFLTLPSGTIDARMEPP